MLGATLACPLRLYVAAEAVIGPVEPGSFAAFDLSLYRSLPTVVLAGLTVFPLVLTESLALALPILAVGVFAPSLQGHQ